MPHVYTHRTVLLAVRSCDKRETQGGQGECKKVLIAVGQFGVLVVGDKVLASYLHGPTKTDTVRCSKRVTSRMTLHPHHSAYRHVHARVVVFSSRYILYSSPAPFSMCTIYRRPNGVKSRTAEGKY